MHPKYSFFQSVCVCVCVHVCVAQQKIEYTTGINKWYDLTSSLYQTLHRRTALGLSIRGLEHNKLVWRARERGGKRDRTDELPALVLAANVEGLISS